MIGIDIAEYLDENGEEYTIYFVILTISLGIILYIIGKVFKKGWTFLDSITFGFFISFIMVPAGIMSAFMIFGLGYGIVSFILSPIGISLICLAIILLGIRSLLHKFRKKNQQIKRKEG